MASSSTAAQAIRQSLGHRLRELRTDAGVTAAELARLMGRHPSKISRIEHGDATPTTSDLRAWCSYCRAEDQLDDLVAQLRNVESMIVEWERLERGGFEALQHRMLGIMEATEHFRIYTCFWLPGILQTERYTRALWRLMMARRGVRDDVDVAIKPRLERRRLLDDGHRRFVFLFEEHLLRDGYGGAEVQIEQLLHLLSVSTMANVALGILPLGPQRTTYPTEDYYIYDDERVIVELISNEFTLTSRREIRMYVQAFKECTAGAAFGPDARDLITRALNDLDPRKSAQDY